MFDPNLRNLVVALFFSGAVVLLWLEWRGRRRQSRLDRMVFTPPVNIYALGPFAGSSTEWLADLILSFCLPEDLQKPPEERGAFEEVDAHLIFRWDDEKKRYFTRLGTILQVAKERGLGRKWSASQEREFWTAVENAVAAAILEREWSMVSITHNAVEG